MKKYDLIYFAGDEGRIFNPATGGHGHQSVSGNEKIARALLNAINKHYG